MPEVSRSKYVILAGWDDVPHLDEKTKAEMLASVPRHEWDARSKGIPMLGGGKIFPIDEKQIVETPFKVPVFWPQIIGMDFGWDHPTAAVRIAWDRDEDVVHLVSDYRRSEAPPVIHAAAIRSWGEWIPIAWPHDGNNDTAAGPNLAGQYRQQRLRMLPNNATFPDGGNSVEAGLMEMLDRMEKGKWKVFSTCQAWMEEFRLYHRDKGKVVKTFDDTVSASRYAMMMLRYAQVNRQTDQPLFRRGGGHGGGGVAMPGMGF